MEKLARKQLTVPISKKSDTPEEVFRTYLKIQKLLADMQMDPSNS